MLLKAVTKYRQEKKQVRAEHLIQNSGKIFSVTRLLRQGREGSCGPRGVQGYMLLGQ